MFSIEQRVNIRIATGLVGVALLSTGCATHNAILERTATAVTPTTDLPRPDPRDLGGDIQSAYYIGPQDKLDITVVNLPELTKTVVVDPSGVVNLPYVGSVPAGGKTPLEVRAVILGRLGHILERPDVTVAVSETVSQRVTVEGAVSQPGVYPINGQSTLLRTIAMARGTSNVANEKIVAVFRTINGQPMAAVFDLAMIRDGRMPDPAIYGNDTIVIERSRGKVLLRDVIGTLPLIGAFSQIDRVASR